MTDWKKRLRYGIAEATALESSGLITFREASSYLSSELGIYGTVIPEQPDEAISLSLYVVSEGIETVVGAQFRMRAKTDTRLDLIEDALSNSWVDRQAGTLRGVSLIMSRWASGAPLGQDGSDRLTRSANYYLTVQRPLRHRS